MPVNASDPAARQYAVALLRLGQEKNIVGRIFEELQALTAAYRADRGFRAFFTSPKIPAKVKLKVLDETIGKQLCEAVRNFIALLIRKRRELLLDNIMDAFDKYRDDAEHRIHVFVETAKALEPGEKDALVRTIHAGTGKDVVYHEVVQPKLIAGMRLRIGDRLLDTSLLRRLHELSVQLVDTGGAVAGAASIEEIAAIYSRIQTDIGQKA